MPNDNNIAPGAPGIEPRWTSSAKSGVGTSLNATSRVWFTLSHGILNEVYYPRIDQACTRDMGLIVTNGGDFFAEEKRNTRTEVQYITEGVPAYKLINTCNQNKFRIEKEIFSASEHDCVLQRIKFVPLAGSLKDYHLYVILAPHLENSGSDDTGWTGEYKGRAMLFASTPRTALALGCSAPWLKRSVGYVGFSDGWKELRDNKLLLNTYDRAENGNIALIGEIDLEACGGEFVLSLGFGVTSDEAGNRAATCIIKKFDESLNEYTAMWLDWIKKLHKNKYPEERRRMFTISSMVMRVHESKSFPGGFIASLSIPWGFSKGDKDIGGYHLVWPRDLVQTAMGLLAAGASEDIKRIVLYLASTQEESGYWPQNMWLDGKPYWAGIQMDETALPILLVDAAWREKLFNDDDIKYLWPMIVRAASYIVRNGPVTSQDRWEEEPGYTLYTLAAEIASLLCAADMAELNNEKVIADYLRETADNWNANIERWTYVTDTPLSKEVGVEGYYVRIAPVELLPGDSNQPATIILKNLPEASSSFLATHIISPDALSLVRFGLRAANDDRIVNTVKVIDKLLKIDTPFGPCWHRYNEDGYGEQPDGKPFSGTGIGRLWPLLTGERGHYELAAGRVKEAEKLLISLEAFSNEGGMISEQIWDSGDIPNHELFFGKPSGSAMPLVWAHSEHVKLLRSIKDNKVFDMPRQTVDRYIKNSQDSPYYIWKPNQKISTMTSGKVFRIELQAKAKIHWSLDNWANAYDTETTDTGLGVHKADLPTEKLTEGATIRFTFLWADSGTWEGTNYSVAIISHAEKQKKDADTKRKSAHEGK
ncbi:MAG: glucan 1,4-alpha-glucosidase [Chloroflexota bacterium]